MRNEAAQDIIIRPVITEKTMDGISQKKYTFEVAKDCHQDRDCQRAVEELFGVKVGKVNTIHVSRPACRRHGPHTKATPQAGRRPSSP